MRVTTAVVVACLGLVSLGLAHESTAAMRQATHIPAQKLGTALTELARERRFQLLYRTELVGNKRTAGASGDMTLDEAMQSLLQGTGLSYRFIDAATVKIVSADQESLQTAPLTGMPASAPSQPPSSNNTATPSGLEPATWPRLAQSDPGRAQEAAASFSGSSSVVLEEVVVTAQKREERLIDVPMAITAVTGDEIERRGVSSLQDLQYSVPGLSVVQSGPGQERIQIRGVTTTNGLPTVGQYLDEMPISIDDNTQSLDLRLIDMERIEVLRGPQGTLYGEGSMGGTIRYLTANPDLTRFGGSFEAQAGARDGRRHRLADERRRQCAGDEGQRRVARGGRLREYRRLDR